MWNFKPLSALKTVHKVGESVLGFKRLKVKPDSSVRREFSGFSSTVNSLHSDVQQISQQGLLTSDPDQRVGLRPGDESC